MEIAPTNVEVQSAVLACRNPERINKLFSFTEKGGQKRYLFYCHLSVSLKVGICF